jgi:hypothetical protein
MEVGRGAGSANAALAVGRTHGREGEQLAYGFLLQREAGRKQHAGLGGCVVQVVHAIAVVKRDGVAGESPLESLEVAHGCNVHEGAGEKTRPGRGGAGKVLLAAAESRKEGVLCQCRRDGAS